MRWELRDAKRWTSELELGLRWRWDARSCGICCSYDLTVRLVSEVQEVPAWLFNDICKWWYILIWSIYESMCLECGPVFFIDAQIGFAYFSGRTKGFRLPSVIISMSYTFLFRGIRLMACILCLTQWVISPMNINFFFFWQRACFY